MQGFSHHFLIATPAVTGDVFEKAVVYICEHSEEGALGLVINKPTEIPLNSVFEQLKLPLARSDLQGRYAMNGGPVHSERGFVLHERMRAVHTEPPSVNVMADFEGWDAVYGSSLPVPNSPFELTTSLDIMQALARGAGPKQVLITLGLSSWGGGQLEEELAANAWLAVAAEPAQELLFDLPLEARYAAALSRLGLEPWMLGVGAGRA